MDFRGYPDVGPWQGTVVRRGRLARRRREADGCKVEHEKHGLRGVSSSGLVASGIETAPIAMPPSCPGGPVTITEKRRSVFHAYWMFAAHSLVRGLRNVRHGLLHIVAPDAWSPSHLNKTAMVGIQRTCQIISASNTLRAIAICSVSRETSDSGTVKILSLLRLPQRTVSCRRPRSTSMIRRRRSSESLSPAPHMSSAISPKVPGSSANRRIVAQAGQSRIN